MKTTQFTFPSKDGRTILHAVRWSPDDGNYTAVLQITHGMVEYIERYAPFAKYLTDRGILVVGHDHLGHGHSVSGAAEYGFFAEKNPSDVLVADMHQLRTHIQKENPNLPYFMLGHSMGSFLLRKYLALHSEGVCGAIIMGTGYVSPAKSAMGLAVVHTMKAVLGSHHRSPLVQKMIYGRSYRGFDTNGKKPENSWLSRDVEMVKKYYSDPLCTFTFTLNGFQGLFEAAQFACKQENAEKIPHDLPILLISGGSDPVGDSGAGVEKVHQMYRKAGFTDLACIFYKGARHEILNEVNREQIFSDLFVCLSTQVEAVEGLRHFPPVEEV